MSREDLNGRGGRSAATRPGNPKRSRVNARSENESVTGLEAAQRILQVRPRMLEGAFARARTFHRHVSNSFCLRKPRLVILLLRKRRAIQENRRLTVKQGRFAGPIGQPLFFLFRLLRRRKFRFGLRRLRTSRHARAHVGRIFGRLGSRRRRRLLPRRARDDEQREQDSLHRSATPRSGAAPLNAMPTRVPRSTVSTPAMRPRSRSRKWTPRICVVCVIV